ncbi:MAG TPA: hypothetical protein VF768_11855, partial [Holophagaceae bacterium]
QLPLQELDRAVGARKRSSEDAPAPAPRALPRLDESIRTLVLLCREGQWREVQEAPPAWWESLEGAPVLQALLDAEGDPALLPEELQALVRGLEAQASRQDAAEGRDATALFLKLEAGYVDREIQANNRMLQDPRVLSDPALWDRINLNLMTLIARQKSLSRQRRLRK